MTNASAISRALSVRGTRSTQTVTNRCAVEQEDSMRNTIGEILAKRAFADPEAEALVDVASGVRLTFVELDERVNQTVRAYRDLGVAKGDRVALLMMNSAVYLEAYFAVARLGAVTVLLNWRLSPAELHYIVADSGASILVFGEEFSEAAAQLHDIGDTHVDRWLYVGEDARRPRFATGFEEARTDARAAYGHRGCRGR